MPVSDYFRPMQGVKQIELALGHLDAILPKLEGEEKKALEGQMIKLGEIQKWLWDARAKAEEFGIELRAEEKELEKEVLEEVEE